MDHHKTGNSFSDHLFEHRTVEKKRLLLALLITATVMIVEVIGGLVTNSIALISDAGHMFTHSFAIAVSLIAILIARKPPCHHRTFGLYRAEILAAFVNGLFLLLIVFTLIYEAILRIIHPLEILAFEMLVVALVGLGVNLLSLFILQGSIKKDLNIKGLFYHIIGDTASSIGIVLAAVVIYYTGWTLIDPFVSLFISLIIAIWAIGILKESTRILLEMTPKGLNIDMVTNELKTQFPEITNLYNVHFWMITPEMLVFSAHMRVNNPNLSDNDRKQLMSGITKYLRVNYNIIESTIQLSK